jgi:hypothetical protein
MVLGWKRPGRVGRRRFYDKEVLSVRGEDFFVLPRPVISREIFSAFGRKLQEIFWTLSNQGKNSFQIR